MKPESLNLPAGLSTFVDLLRWRAKQQPDRHAFTFLPDGQAETYLTYRALDHQARTVGGFLQHQGTAGARVLLLYPPGLEFIAAFFGCLYAGAVAVPAYPPHPGRWERTWPGLRAIASEIEPSLVLTTTTVRSMVESLLPDTPDLAALPWVASDEMGREWEAEWREPNLRGATLAFLQYTSGSTARPRGVMVSHENLLHNSALIHERFETTPASRGVLWLPFYHDMGLIGGILETLYIGAMTAFLPPVTFLMRPVRWLQAISRLRATISGGPNFAYDLCVRKITPEQLAALDLSCWEVAFNGAEPVREETLDRFATMFEPAGFRREAFYPCYGLAEATLFATGGRRGERPRIDPVRSSALERGEVISAPTEDAEARSLVGCGQVPQGQRVVIVDPESLRSCPPDRVGEIWIAGPSVARGYWNQPELTEQTFQARLADTGEGPFLRTGDLGFLQDGELFVTGRLKDLIIVGGRNHYPHDIEQTVERSHSAIRPGGCAAFSVDVEGQERLIVVAEVDRRFLSSRRLDESASDSAEVESVIRAIRQAVAEDHDLRVHAVSLLKPGAIPKTSSGKIQRHACRAGFLAGSLEVIG